MLAVNVPIHLAIIQLDCNLPLSLLSLCTLSTTSVSIISSYPAIPVSNTRPTATAV